MASVGNIITSRANPRVKQLRAAFAGSLRLNRGLIAIEGEHLIIEALRSGLTFQTIFATESASLPANLSANTEIVYLSRDVFASAVATESPQGIAALLDPPQRTISMDNSPLMLIAAGLQDPGNLGTLIRSAEAFGAAGVILTPGTVSPWNQKALRASAGSIFRVPIETRTSAQLDELKQQGIQLIAAVAIDGKAPEHLNLTQPTAVLIGNEGAGLAPDLLALADARITLRCPGPVESLNAAVAGSLLLYEASQQRSRIQSAQH